MRAGGRAEGVAGAEGAEGAEGAAVALRGTGLRLSLCTLLRAILLGRYTYEYEYTYQARG